MPNNPTQPSQFVDTDRDGIPDWLERHLGTDPHSSDTDRDGMRDGDEIRLWRNPRNPDTDYEAIPIEALPTVGAFAQQVGSFQGMQYVFNVQPEMVAITALDGRPGLNGAGLIYQQYGDQIESALRQTDINNFALVQTHLNQAAQNNQPAPTEITR
ncbi:hypothetical protein IQ266_21935 [filamentous cyanobacterium LEGE 11480]|uniref:Uncharacterized protein n=1 Tax=Romeriopsis navalis LEGE 11480 TaxID=2777977 RepID=A0A928Z6A1_9CYAN|nr:hypothetical protein [Romeriopsis navalis]MBE9032403.1 hypothetical protein [Romeriopsis navalis LEGE 11480]